MAEQKVTNRPKFWNEEAALDFPSLWSTISQHHPWGHPVSYFIIAIIFFEETAFCNIKQGKTSGSLGVGFGQLEVSNPEKKNFYEWLKLPTDHKKVAQMMLDNKEFSVKVHCKYFQYLTLVKGKGLQGCLEAQVGPHREYIPLFLDGERQLKSAWDSNNRAAYIKALNYARWNSPKQNGIREDLFPDFWRFILPDSWFILGY